MEDVTARLQHALDLGGNTHTLADVADAVEAGEAQLWVADGAVIVTEITRYPQAQVCRFWLAAGELEPVLDLARRIYDWAKEQGCDRAVMTGRKGWQKPLSEEGWAPTMVSYEKRL